MKTKTILVVEDEEALSLILKKKLTAWGYTTVMMDSGEKALIKALEINPDLILMDVVLNGKLTGIETAALIKKQADIPIIFMTSYCDEQSIEAADNVNPYGYIVKPFDEFALKINIQLALKRYESEKGLEEKYRLIFENAPIGILLADEKGNIIEANEELLKILGSPSLDKTKEINLFSYIPLIEAGITAEVQKSILTGNECNLLTNYKTKWGKKIHMSLSVRPLKNSSGQVNFFQVVIQDMNQKKELQDSLIENITKLTSFFENSFDGITLTNEEGKIELWNPAMEKITKITQNDAKNRNIWEVLYHLEMTKQGSESRENEESLKKNVINMLKTGSVTEKKVLIRELMVEGRKTYLQTVYFPVKTLKGYIYASINRDITDLIVFQNELIKTKEEKELLVQEIHHRVKNNLQIISGLLSIEQTRTQNADLKNTLQNCISRIESMSLIHNELYHREDFPTLNMNSFLDNLTRYLNAVYGKPDLFIKIEVNSENIQLSLINAVPCGLITNELITNVLKYAFVGRTEGFVKIDLIRLKNGNLLFAVKDNGIGLPEDFRLSELKGLGLTLVQKLTRQLKGKLDIKTGAGTEVSIEFKG